MDLQKQIEGFLDEQTNRGLLVKRGDKTYPNVIYRLTDDAGSKTGHDLRIHHDASIPGLEAISFITGLKAQYRPEPSIEFVIRNKIIAIYSRNIPLPNGIKSGPENEETSTGSLTVYYNPENGEATSVTFIPVWDTVERKFKHNIADGLSKIPKEICTLEDPKTRVSYAPELETVSYSTGKHDLIDVNLKIKGRSITIQGDFPRNIKDPESVKQFLRKGIEYLLGNKWFILDQRTTFIG